MRTKRFALVAASLVLVGGMTAACGDNAPKNATEKEFCAAFEKANDAGSDKEKVDKAIDEMKDAGTPEGIPDDARKGFDFLMENAGDEDLKFEDLSEDEKSNFEAFMTYYGETCSPEAPEAPEAPESE